MALKTLGTNANNSLQAFLVGFNDQVPADLGSINTGIKRDPPGWGVYNQVASTGLVTGTGTVRASINQAYISRGVLVIPNRGQLMLKNGDWVCWDATTGWPIVISGDAGQNGPYTHS